MKVRITKDQPVPEQEGCFVLGDDGDYDSFDLVEFYHESQPNVSKGAFQAQYMKFGGVVYRDQEYIDLLKNLDVIDEEKKKTVDEIIAADTSTVIEPPAGA